LDICKLFYDCLLMNEEESHLKFMDFQRNHQEMAALFESFVRNFYQAECRQFKVKREIIYWDAEGEDLSILPQMQTDISMECATYSIIMDTKFYHSAYVQRYDSEKLISGNLYQMFAYLNNYQQANSVNKPIIGILLYPKVDKDLDLSFLIKGHRLDVYTVDLNKSGRPFTIVDRDRKYIRIGCGVDESYGSSHRICSDGTQASNKKRD
jgi:5-methylcytosine-specific restriction enzyme subunit McrC